MNTDIATVLRDTLASHAEIWTDDGDPWQRFVTAERRHRRNRRLRIGAGAVAGVAVLGLAGTGFIPVPSWTPAITIEQATSPLLDEPPKGSLAADAEWLAGFRAAVPTLLAQTWAGDTDGHWKVEHPDKIRVLFAGDVFDDRQVVAVVPLRTGLLRAEATVWFRGPVGAEPSELEDDGSSGNLTEPYVSRVEVENGIARALVLAPDGSRAEVSGEVTYRADGTVARTWTELPAAPSGEMAGELPASGYSQLALRIALPGQDFEAADWHGGGGDSGTDDEHLRSLVAEAVSGLSSAHRQVALDVFLLMEISQAGLDTTATTATAYWAGHVDGQPAVLLALQPDGGGVLLYAGRVVPPDDAEIDEGAVASSVLDLRLLAPAAGAYTRPYAWRLHVGEDEGAEGRVVAVAPPGADRLELRLDDGTRIPVELDATGAGTATLSDSDQATVVAYAVSGRVLGETPVPPRDTGHSSVPGESAATSVVLSSN